MPHGAGAAWESTFCAENTDSFFSSASLPQVAQLGVSVAHERLELVAALAAGVFEDRHQAILPVRSATHLPSLSRISSGSGTAFRAAVSKHTSTVFCVAQCVIASAS